MLLLKEIKGQTNALRYLFGNITLGRIASSYLFQGPEGVGRALAAKAFIMTLICREKPEKEEACGECPACRRVMVLKHPDLIWIKPEKNKLIKIEEVRKVRTALNLKPYEATLSICVIEDAHMMTREASNALLKILEEPPGDSMLILITNKRELLLDTVLSRCAEVKFSLLSARDTKDIIMREAPETSEEQANFLAYFSQGSPGTALEMLRTGLAKRREDVISMLERIVGAPHASCLNWDNDQKNRIFEDLEILIMLFRDSAMKKEKIKDIDKIYRVVERLIAMRLALAGNVNPKLVAQALPAVLAGTR